MDKEMDTNFIGIPKEGIGFSNDAYEKCGPEDFEEWLVTDKVSHALIEESELRVKDISLLIKEQLVSYKKVKFKSHLVNFLGKVESPAARLF